MARYSRPAFEQNEALHDELEEMTNPAPSVSLKFAMPPIAQVRSSPFTSSLTLDPISIGEAQGD